MAEKKKSKNPSILYIEAESKPAEPEKFFIDSIFIKRLPKDIFLCYTIQNKRQAEAMKKELIANNIRVHGFQQVIGCTRLKTPYNIVLIGQGRFHALNLAIQNPQHPVHVYCNGSSIAITKKDLEEHEKRKQGALSLFFAKEKIGILASTKPGQEKLKEAEALKKRLEKKYTEKKFFILISNTLNLHEMQNFDFDVYINTACPGLAYDSPRILNLDDILPFL